MTKEGHSYSTHYVGPSTPFPVFPEGSVCYVDLETYKGNYGDALCVQHNRVRLVTFTTDARCTPMGATDVWVVDMLDAAPERWRALLGVLESYETICGHNLTFDLPILIRHGMRYPRKLRDTIVASRVLRNGTIFHHGLDVLLDHYFDIRYPEDLSASDWGVRWLSTQQLDYAAMDVAYMPRLHDHLTERLAVQKLTQIYELECSIVSPIASMTLNGVLIDREEWLVRSRKAAADKDALTPELLKEFPLPEPEPLKQVRYKKDGTPYEADLKKNKRIEAENAVRKWNLASPKQVLEMFQQVGVTLPDTSYETMATLRDDNPVVEKFLRWRDLEKQAGTFGEEWLQHVFPDGRVYPNCNQLRAASGRMSYSDPNMQQLPRGSTRKAVIAPPGKVLVRADFSQIEARIAAKISGDPVLIELFQKGDDIHAYAAKAVLGKLNVTPAERQIGKSLVFGLLFSMSAPSLRVYCSTNYGVKFTLPEAEVFRDRFFRTFYGLARWHDRIRRECNYANAFWSLVGRRRIVAHLRGGDVNMLGLGLNTPVQGTAADMLKIAVRELWERRDEHPNANLIMLVHDEIIYEVPEGEADAVAGWLKGVMIESGNVILNPIPCDASVKIGKSWGG